MPRERLGALPDGEYYWQDIIGLEVYTTEGLFRGMLHPSFRRGATMSMCAATASRISDSGHRRRRREHRSCLASNNRQFAGRTQDVIRFDVLSIFPEMLRSPLQYSLLKKACDKGLIEIGLHNIRDWTEDKHNMTDDAPYGGGCGMVMKVEPVERALAAVKRKGVPEEVVCSLRRGGRSPRKRRRAGPAAAFDSGVRAL
jgi:hypothetical protein